MIVYEEIEPIRKTSKSYVALAVVEGYSQPMILKKLDCTNTALYEQLTNIQNEHIARIYEIEERNGSLLLVEEYVDGFPLNEYVQKMGLSNDEIIDLMLQLCDGLQTLHHADPPIIHRDLKPGNILVSEQGILKIIDFDASRSYKPEHSHDTVIMGTAEYASPEQYGFAQTDVRSDIYSFGAILYELLFQQTLPRNSSAEAAIEQAPTKEFVRHTVKRQPNSLHELKNDRQTSALLQIINRCTMFDPNERFSSVEELARALQQDHMKQPSRRIRHVKETKHLLYYGNAASLYPRVKRDAYLMYALHNGFSLYEVNDYLKKNTLNHFKKNSSRVFAFSTIICINILCIVHNNDSHHHRNNHCHHL